MYETFFSLSQKPFALTSNPSFLYLSPRHQEALANMVYGIRERVGFIQITGEVGTGKTTLCRALLNQLERTVKTAYIFNPALSGPELMRTVIEDLGIQVTGRGTAALFSSLNRFLIEQLSLNNNVVLIIDEAQNLPNRSLEQIRMLSNLEVGNEKLLQIILVGQPELRDKLEAPELRQVKQRIAIRYHIEALDSESIPKYIEHRLRLAGANGEGPLFDDSAVRRIAEFTAGVPRLINVVCDKALLLAYVQDRRTVDDSMIGRCITEIEGGVANEHHQ